MHRGPALTVLLLVWVLPVLAAAAFLAAVGLPVLAAGLLAAEAVVGTTVWLARRGDG
ncbi:MAG TPA: hypothetical protein VNU66_03645 [Mycobacteriales bacterium]|nr:hypothetical protein [Mycobacteriales bacterium]